ncbi:MAG: hypothetical protein KBF75_12630 [Saprospiraceae bacterium]|nr:hypothetical protein [Saprospiraceae bacterium]
MRYYIFFVFGFSFSNIAGQPIGCEKDSLFYHHLDSILDRDDTKYYLKERIYYEGDSICLIKRVAYSMDKLFERGLNLHDRLKPEPKYDPNDPFNQTTIIKKYNKIELFLFFIILKESYENLFYPKLSDKQYLEVVNDVILYGAFKYPKQVKDVLSFKYKSLSKDKFYEDMRYYFRKKKKG